MRTRMIDCAVKDGQGCDARHANRRIPPAGKKETQQGRQSDPARCGGRKRERATKLFERRPENKANGRRGESRQTHRREKSQSSLSKLGLNSPGARLRHCHVHDGGSRRTESWHRTKHVSLAHGPVCPSGTAGPSLPSPGRPYMIGSWFLVTAGGRKPGWKPISPSLATTKARGSSNMISEIRPVPAAEKRHGCRQESSEDGSTGDKVARCRSVEEFLYNRKGSLFHLSVHTRSQPQEKKGEDLRPVDE